MRLTPEQQQLLDDSLDLVANSPEGHGEVVIIVNGGKVRLIRHMISLDASKGYYLQAGEKWYRSGEEE